MISRGVEWVAGILYVLINTVMYPMKHISSFYVAQIVALAAGTTFAWYSVYTELSYFYSIYGTIFRFVDCVPPNPLLQACFYGAFVFLIALIWAVRIYQGKVANVLKHQLRLTYLLIAGTLFGWGNVAFMFYADANSIANTFTCSLEANANPFTSSCFIGSVLFTLSLVCAGVTYYKVRQVQ